MDIERSLVSRVAQQGQAERLLSIGIEEVHFSDPAAREIWKTCVEHQRRYKAPLSFGEIKKKFPSYSWDITTDTLDYLVDQFITTIKRRVVIDGIRDLARVVDDPQEIANADVYFLEKAKEISQTVPSAGRVARFSEMGRRIEEYHEDPPQGISMGLQSFDDITLGIQPHEYISIVGWQGTGKSSLLQWMLFNIYLNNKTPMLISLEMEGSALYRKWDAMAANLEYHALKAHKLQAPDMKKWEAWAERAAKAKNDIIVLDDLGRCTVEKVYAETLRYSPDIVGVDYISLMDAPRNMGALWEKVTHITQGLKQNARSLRIPVIGVAQTNRESAREGPKLENISYARSIGQDSDIVISLEASEEMRASKRMGVKMLKNRDGRVASTNMYWDMDKMEFREWEGTDYFKEEKEEAVHFFE